MSSRDDILARVRANQPAAQPLPGVPTFETGTGSLLERFKAAVIRMGGKVVDAPADGNLDALVRQLFHDANVVCSATSEVQGNRPIDGVKSPGELNDVDVGVVRAAFGVAETGSVWLTDAQFKVNTLGFATDFAEDITQTIVPDMHHAYSDRAQFDARYGVFMTGPSATADIEGILIHGAQGIRSLTIVPSPARPE